MGIPTFYKIPKSMLRSVLDISAITPRLAPSGVQASSVVPPHVAGVRRTMRVRGPPLSWSASK